MGIAFLASIPAAQAQIYKVTLNGANEIPVVVTPGTGSAIITLNPVTHEMRVRVSFTGLIGNSTASHVHCCAVQPTNAGVATTSPTFPGTPLGVTSGSWDRTYDMSQAGAWNAPFVAANGGTAAGAEAAFIAGVKAGQVYLNIHSSVFGGGEIRGFLILNSFAANAAGNAKGAGAALDSLGAGTGVLSDALVNLAALSTAEQAVAIDKLKPTSSRGTLVAVSESVSTAFDQVSNRLDGLRLADGGQTPVVPTALGNLPDQAHNGFWVSANGVNSRQKSKDGFAGYTNGGWGMSGGFDRRLAPRQFVGGGVSYFDSSLTYRNQAAGDHADMTSTQVTLYGSQGIGRVFIDGMAAYGWQEYDTTRNTGLTGIAAGKFHGHLWGSRLSAGTPIGLSSRVSVTPEGRLDWDKIRQYGYTETGGGPLALGVESRSAQRFRGSLGGQLDFATHTGDFKAKPFVRAFWHHNFSNDAINSPAAFVSGGTSFFTPGQELDRDPYSLGAGINFYTEGAFTAALVYDGNFSKGYQSHAYQAKLRWTF